MSHILHRDSSPRESRSDSRALTKEFVSNWAQHHPQGTVTYRDVGVRPVLPKKMLVMSTRGSSYAAGTDLASYGFQEPYLRAGLGLIGVSDITFIRAENLNEREDSRRQSLAKTHDLIRQTTTTW